MRFIGIVFIFLYSLTTLASSSYKASEVLAAAESAFMRGDLFNANRYYDLAYEKVPQILNPENIENMVIIKNITLPPAEFLSYCKKESRDGKFKVETQFYCAKNLIHSEKYIDAVEFIEKIPKEYQRLEYSFLKASLYLKLNKVSQCLEEIESAQKKVTENTSPHFRDLIQVINARCLLADHRYAEALNKFQTLSVNSDFYLTTLEEQAWAQFKIRNLISSRDILKILISYFTGQDIKDQIFGADVYFRTKYLQAYIELISENREKSQQMFSDLKGEIQKFRKENLAKMAVPKDLEGKLSKLKSFSQLLTKDYSYISKFRNFMNTWSTPEESKGVDQQIRYLMAVNVELNTIRNLKFASLKDYERKLKTTQRLQTRMLISLMDQYFRDSRRNIDSMEFKANMGQIENFWASRTEGKRTLSEVLDAYKKEVTLVEDYIGK